MRAGKRFTILVPMSPGLVVDEDVEASRRNEVMNEFFEVALLFCGLTECNM
jgi:hypothetical protein